MNEGNRQVNVSGIGKPEAERIKSTNWNNGGKVKVTRHGNRIDNFEDFDEEESEGGTEGHVDHGEGDWERPIVKLLIEDVFVVNDDGEAEEDPNADVGVRQDDVLDDIVAQRATFAHCCVVVLFLSGSWEDREMREMVNEEEEEEEGVRADCGEVGE